MQPNRNNKLNAADRIKSKKKPLVRQSFSKAGAECKQADNLAKLWRDILSVIDLIAQIFCAVED